MHDRNQGNHRGGHDHHVHDIGHNHAHGPAEHLHSHVKGRTGRDRAEEVQVLAASFVTSFRQAEDKNSYLRLSGIPFERTGRDGLAMKLIDAAIVTNWQIGTASPAFASRELVYMPFPGDMITPRETMTFTYVSLTEREDVDLVDLLAERVGPDGTEEINGP